MGFQEEMTLGLNHKRAISKYPGATGREKSDTMQRYQGLRDRVSLRKPKHRFHLKKVMEIKLGK